MCHFDKVSCIYCNAHIHLFCFDLLKFLLRSRAATCPPWNAGTGHPCSHRSLFVNVCKKNGRRQPFWMSKNHFFLIAFLTISDRYPNFIFVNFFTTWPLAAILNVRKSLSIAFLAISDRSVILGVLNSLSIAFLEISDRYGTFYIFLKFWQNDRRRPFWMSEKHFRSHFWPFQIDTDFF